MNSGLPEMLHCLTGGGGLFTLNHDDQGIGDVVGRAIKPDPGLVYGWGDDLDRIVLNYRNGSNFEMGYAPAAAANTAAELSSPTGDSNSKKRKADKAQTFKVASEGNYEGKKMKVCAEEESNKSTTTTTGSSGTNKKNQGPSNSNSKVSDVPKPDYIHVRARRGQATDSHSLAERVRREKISERMKYLQDLVPGCNKITGKAGMLDEIINYVQSLQRQVEFLSMKLAAINPTVDFDIDSYVTKEIFPACLSSFPASAHLQFNSLVQGVSGAIPEMGVMNPTDVTLRRATAPVSIIDTFLESSSLNQIQNLSWEDELQNLLCMEYQQGRPASFTSQTFTGLLEAGHVKLEM